MSWYEHEQVKKEQQWGIHEVNDDMRMERPINEHDYIKAANYLTARNLNPVLAFENEWEPVFRRGLRILIPAITMIPNHRYWQARSLTGEEPRYESPHGPRRDALVVVSKRNHPLSMACVVEGPMDALAMADIEGCMGIALMGIKPPKEALNHLAALLVAYPVVYCICDTDQIHGMMQVQNFLATRGIYSEIKIPPGGKDVAEMTTEERQAIVK